MRHFAIFKPKYHQAKILKLSEKVLSGQYRLSVADMLCCAKQPWKDAFSIYNCLKAWDLIGIQPFTK